MSGVLSPGCYASIFVAFPLFCMFFACSPHTDASHGLRCVPAPPKQRLLMEE